MRPYDVAVGSEIVIVVVSYNSAHVIGALLDSIPDALGGLKSRTVVVDNASSDNTCEVVGARSDCVLVRAENLGYSAGINRGVKELAGDGAILILNPDARLEVGSVRTMVDALSLPGTGIVAPKIFDDRGELVKSLRREPTLGRALGLGRTGRAALSEYVTEDESYDRPQIVDWVLGAVLMVGRECYEQLAGWDESFFLYSEETDFCLRARDLGWLTRYVPQAAAMHIGGESGQSPRIHSMQIVNRVRLFRRRHTALSSFVYLLLAVASETSWAVRGNKQSLNAIKALLLPSSRPWELGCSDRLLPR